MSKRASVSVAASAERSAREAPRARPQRALRSHAEGTTGRGWSPPATPSNASRLPIGGVDDVHEREAERAELAVGTTPSMAVAGLSPVPARIQTIAGVRGDGFEHVNDRTSPVVEVVPTRTDGGKMRAGRIYLGLNSSDSRHQDVKLLFDALKKATAAWAKAEPGAVRIGPGAAAKAKDGARLESLTGERIALKGKAR